MGSRGRSIRLRMYFLVAIPVITMLGLFGYVAYISVSNWVNLDRSPGLIEGTSVPITRFVSLLQAERRAAVVYLSHPDTANANTYQASVTATKAGEVPLEAALNSPGTKSSANAQETAAITTWVGEVNGMAEAARRGRRRQADLGGRVRRLHQDRHRPGLRVPGCREQPH